MKDMEITQELIHKWGSYGLLENSKNDHNLTFAYEYSANKLLISDNLFDFNNIGTYIFPIVYRVFNKFSITLNQDFIKSKINIILEEFEFEFNRYMIQNDNLRGEFDLEATFCLQFSRKHHFNQDQTNLFNKTFTNKINKKEFRIYLNSSLNNKKYYTLSYKNGNSYLGHYNSLIKIFSIRTNIFTKYRNRYKINSNQTYDLVKNILEINLNKTIKRLKFHFK